MGSKGKVVSLITQYIENCKGFEQILKKVKIVSAGNGNCLAEYKVDEDATNVLGSMHGGYSATLVDAISSFALYFSNEENQFPSVSTDMHLSYLKTAKMGETVLIDAKTLRAGKSLAYLDVEIKNKETGELLIKGSHTKFILRN